MSLLHPLESSILPEGVPGYVSETDAYRDIRSRVLTLGYLPYWEAEDLASDVWASARKASAAEFQSGPVRRGTPAEVLAYIGRMMRIHVGDVPVPMALPSDDEIRKAITDRRKAILSRREESNDVRLDDDSLTTYLDDFRADGLEAPEDAYRKALGLPEVLRVPNLASVVAALTMGLTYATEEQTARALKVKFAAWHKRVSEGRTHILSRIDSPSRLLALLASEREAVLRTAPAVGHDKGQPLYRVGLSQSRTSRATVLLALPQRDGHRSEIRGREGHSERMTQARVTWSEVQELPGLNRIEEILLGGRTEGYSTRPLPTVPAPWTRPDVTAEAHGSPADVLQWIEVHLDREDDRRTDVAETALSRAGTHGTPAEVLSWIEALESYTTERPRHPAEWWPNGLTAGQAHYVWPHPAIRRRAILTTLGHAEDETQEDR